MTARAAEMRTVTDGAGRQAQIPIHIERVFAAGPPAAITLFTLAPDKLLGWTSPLKEEAKAYLPPNVAALAAGLLTGRANTANVESVLAARPDIIVDLGDVDPDACVARRARPDAGRHSLPHL